MWLVSIFLSLVATRIIEIVPYINYFSFRQNSIPMFARSVGIFLWVLNLKPNTNQVVNRIAKHVLPCYLIQSNPFWSNKLWGWVDSIIPKQGWVYPLSVVGIVIGLVVCFMLFDMLICLGLKGLKCCMGFLFYHSGNIKDVE